MRNSLVRLKALTLKESYQIIRDPSSLLISFFLPLLLLFLYGYGVSLDLNHVKLGVVMEDTSPTAQSFVQSLSDSTYFDVKIARDRRELEEDLIAGHIRGMVIIPSYFSQFKDRPDQIAPIQVIADGSETNTANFVQNYVQGAFQNFLAQENPPQISQIQLEPRYWYNSELESRYFLLSGALAIIMTLTGALLTALVVAREWERGTMEALLSTPITTFEILMGKTIPYFVLGMLSMGMSVILCITIFGLPFRGSLCPLMLVSAVFLFSALGLGLMISTLAKNQILAYQTAIIVAFLPSYMLSGFLFEISSMPTWIQWLTEIIPARYFVQSLQTLFMVGDIWPLILWDMLPMAVIGAIFYLISAFKTLKRLPE